VAASDAGSEKSAQRPGAVEVERHYLADWCERSLQLPADLAVLAEQQDLHSISARARLP